MHTIHTKIIPRHLRFHAGAVSAVACFAICTELYAQESEPTATLPEPEPPSFDETPDASAPAAQIVLPSPEAAPPVQSAAPAPQAAAARPIASAPRDLPGETPEWEPEPPRREKTRRDSWYTGLAFGSGWASTTYPGRGAVGWEETFRGLDSTRLSFDFEVGATLSAHWLVGGRIGGITESYEGPGGTATLTHAELMALGTYFPLPDGEGLFVRGGVGRAALAISVKEQSEDTASTASVAGLGGLLGLGYAGWAGESFNLTVSNEFHIATFFETNDPTSPTSGWYNQISVGFFWY